MVRARCAHSDGGGRATAWGAALPEGDGWMEPRQLRVHVRRLETREDIEAHGAERVGGCSGEQVHRQAVILVISCPLRQPIHHLSDGEAEKVWARAGGWVACEGDGTLGGSAITELAPRYFLMSCCAVSTSAPFASGCTCYGRAKADHVRRPGANGGRWLARGTGGAQRRRAARSGRADGDARASVPSARGRRRSVCPTANRCSRHSYRSHSACCSHAC